MLLLQQQQIKMVLKTHIHTHIYSLTHILIHSYTHKLISSLLHSYNRILEYSHTHILMCSHTYILYTRILIYSYTHTVKDKDGNEENKAKDRVEEKKNNKKRALITGITGQDGSYLAEFLLGMYVCMCVCMYVYMYIYVCMCMNVIVCMYPMCF